ncbi:MAG: hypothetical protein ABS49_00780 [Erythrobacter sp. SCN 62-14]|nr:MAG: hypothetical protein ABS49_00780 [Erythrobacter sp. SCN 62-14]
MANITPYGLRMPPDLKEALDASARQNGRSLNSEIVARLQQSIEADQTVPDFVTPELYQQVKVLGQELEGLRAQVRALEIRTSGQG